MVTAIQFAEHLQVACDEAIAAFKADQPEPESFKQVTDWLEVDGWDALIADLGDQMAINLTALGYYQFTDIELRANRDIPDDQPISDTDRLQWGREQVDQVLNNYDDDLLPSVHAYQLTSSDGESAWVGCLVEIHGQGGPVCDWKGLWPSREVFWHALGSEYGYWVTPLMGDVTDEAILSHWQKPKPARKRRDRTLGNQKDKNQHKHLKDDSR
jgi:hypothetical protein